MTVYYTLFTISLVDLGSIKDTCQRLQQLADQSYKLRKDKSIKIDYDSMVTDIWNLKHFGKLANFLKLNRIRSTVALEQILQKIGKYSNEHWKSFSLHIVDGKDVSDESLMRLGEIMENVEIVELIVEESRNDRFFELLLGYCKNLKEVILVGDEMDIKPLFFSKNVNITRLEINGQLNDDILEEICKHLPHLECLTLEGIDIVWSTKISNLSRLTKLKKTFSWGH